MPLQPVPDQIADRVLSLLRSDGPDRDIDEEVVRREVPILIDRIDRAVIAGSSDALVTWAKSAVKVMDNAELHRLLHAASTAYAKKYSDQYGTGELGNVVSFLLRARMRIQDEIDHKN